MKLNGENDGKFSGFFHRKFCSNGKEFELPLSVAENRCKISINIIVGLLREHAKVYVKVNSMMCGQCPSSKLNAKLV